MVFSVGSEESYNALTAWINDIQGGVPEGTVKILVGMKIDGERKVPTETARNFASQKDYIYMEASAKSGGKPVEEVFKMAAAKVLGIPLPQPPVSAHLILLLLLHFLLCPRTLRKPM